MPQRHKPLTWRQRLRLLWSGTPYRSITRENAQIMQDSGGIAIVPAGFTCKMECHNREQFQGEGHFVNTKRPFLEDGKIDFRDEGKPESPDQFILELRSPAHDEQILRVQADTLPNAKALMAETIVNQFWTWCYQTKISVMAYQDFDRLNREYSTLRHAIEAKGMRVEDLIRGFDPNPSRVTPEQFQAMRLAASMGMGMPSFAPFQTTDPNAPGYVGVDPKENKT